MKKIKSVKLKNDYNDGVKVFKKNTVLLNSGNLFKVNNATGNSLTYYLDEILSNKTDLFEIEYEEERKYIDVRIEFENEDYTDSWKPAMIRDIERTLNNNFIMTKKFKIIELAEGIL